MSMTSLRRSQIIVQVPGDKMQFVKNSVCLQAPIPCLQAKNSWLQESK